MTKAEFFRTTLITRGQRGSASSSTATVLLSNSIISPRNTLNANGYAGAVRQVNVLRVNPDLHLLVDAFGQRVAHAIPAGDTTRLPPRIDQLPTDISEI